MAEKKLMDSRAIVTGAAQGIGEVIARTFADEGASVAVADLNLEGAARVAAEIAAAGGTALAVGVDVRDPQSVAKMVETVLGRWSAVDILVNNAGGFHRFASIDDTTAEQWDEVLALNLRSVFLCSQAVAGPMIARKKGRIISIASKAGVHPDSRHPAYLPYAAAKGGIILFTKHLAMHLAPHGITVNSIAPSTALTPRVQKIRDAESLRQIAAENPLGHLVEPRDVAEAALFLASDSSRYITGINLNVNAGAIML